MSDSFAELWNSSAPQKPQQSLSSLAAQQQQQQRRPQGPDLFTLLASSSAAPAQRPPQPSLPQKPQKPQKQPQQDAFSDLFSSSSQSSNQNLTIAQRAALADRQRQASSPQVHVEKDSSTWAGLDSLGAGFGGLVPTPIASSSNTSLGDSKSSRPSSQNKTKLLSPDDDWGLGDLAAPQTNPAPSGSSLWDLDEFTSHPTTTKDTSPKQRPESRVDSPSNDFDFGNHEDGLLSENQGDDDFMSVFNKPPQPKQPALPPRPTNRNSTPSPPSLPRSTSRSSSSPPPHLLGQIVEMGFPIPQARAALAANNNDVQAALNQLLASEGGHSSTGRGTPNSQTRVSPAPSPPASISSQQQPALPRRRDREILREREQQVSSPSPASTGAGVQAQAEQLLAQATVMGRGMFSKASSFLKEKSAQVQKAVEEHRSSSGAGGSAGSVNGRPRWAQGPGVEERGFRDSDEPSGGFKDSEPEPEVRIPRRVDRQRTRTRERVKEPAAASIQEPEIDLFAPSEPNSSLPQLFDVQTSATPPLPTRPRQRQQRHRSPTTQPSPPKFQRNTTTIPHAITTLKSDANAAFKLGQFGDAENLYTRAIESLGKSSNNDNSIYYVLLLNNRANARMKIGDVNGAVKDCEAVVGVVTADRLKLHDEFDALGTGGGPNKPSTVDEVKINWEPAHDTDFGKIQISISNGSSELVDLGEGLVKAIKRRADAYEGMEKWGHAKKDWEWLRSTSWVRDNMRGEAGRGVERCVRMVGGGKDANGSSTANGSSSSPPSSARQSLPSTKRKPIPKAIPSRNTKPSEALQNLRSTTAQAEAEDQAKYELKDAVDSKLSAWKNGKETNIRALLASLDLVLWEELLNSGGSSVKVGMHEVVTPTQVKIKYMKAVARVHPDKLNANNSTVEQRMIAQGVFGALNEAWNAFKQ